MNKGQWDKGYCTVACKMEEANEVEDRFVVRRSAMYGLRWIQWAGETDWKVEGRG